MKLINILINKSSTTLNTPKIVWDKNVNLAFIAFSLVGFLDAIYLTAKHYSGGSIVCSLTNGCTDVLTSQYSILLNLPTALWGAIYYLIILLAALLYLNNKNKYANYILNYFTIIGFLMSIWLVYLQFWIIKAICPYCMVSAVTSTILFILSFYLLFKHKQIKQ